ncbi:MAG: malonic semialdehyde reductase [Roseibium sp.]|uniref:malonic semialdehyde reductase n=1 Tax=Roseibium sp. TaxID=1936156 RepID=UPI001B03C92B|nr:malonic semialdehyde reductase [Roseibium sp.]MBO6507115.1 malonic semialdehyde reductase [Roseibium sp.]MBO6892567.1 malonic semialdehyde reductase [Roseibium sp.]MBO6930326.1 malonic semialdehyde reductase [Roseibium sp.]
MTMAASKAPTGEALAKLRAEAQANIRDLREKIGQLDDDAIDLILRTARSHYAWQDKPVSRETLETIYEITAAGPTSMNTCPARFFFIETPEAKKRLAKSLKDKNIDKMMSAPATVIIAHDLEFWKELPYLFPHEDRRPHFEGKPEHSETTAFRNGTLQGAYFMIAARALGLDVGAMSGFSNKIVDEEFFAGTTLKSNFLCNLGYADETALFQKLPRLPFDTACKFL